MGNTSSSPPVPITDPNLVDDINDYFKTQPALRYGENPLRSQAMDYKGRSVVDRNLHPSVVDRRLAENSLGVYRGLVRMTRIHEEHRDRSLECLPEDECILWFRDGRKLRTFDQIATGYKAAYFSIMATELNKMGIGDRRAPLKGRFKTDKEVFLERCKRRALQSLFWNARKSLFPTATFEEKDALMEYIQRRGVDETPIELIETPRSRESDPDEGEPPEVMYARLLDYARSVGFFERTEECPPDEPNQALHTDIVVFNRGILSAPRFNTDVTLWRYIMTPTPTLLNQYAERGNVVPVDRFLSTGLSPIATASETRGSILLRIDLPPEFPFWILSSGMEKSASLEHREAVMPYTLDVSGATLDYGVLVRKVTRNTVLHVENTNLEIDWLVQVTPTMLTKPIKLRGLSSLC